MIYALVSRLNNSSMQARQRLKLVIYSLLLINFALYIRNDWVISSHTLSATSTLIDWTRAFAVTIDESAWIMLLILFEMETYLLADNALSKRQSICMQLVRGVCYVSLAHTLYAYTVYVDELNSAVLIQGVDNLCQLVGQNLSYAYNLVYTKLDANNCAGLSTAAQFYFIDPPTFVIVEDRAGLTIELQLAWVDLIEAVVWLLILFTIEIAVWLQDRNIGEGQTFAVLAKIKGLLYFLLWLAIIYWMYRGHYMFAWDEFVWIAGFFAIEMNMRSWRQEIIQAKVAV